LRNGMVLSILRLAKDSPSATVLTRNPLEIDAFQVRVFTSFLQSISHAIARYSSPGHSGCGISGEPQITPGCDLR
jgi:hypothetical protein